MIHGLYCSLLSDSIRYVIKPEYRKTCYGNGHLFGSPGMGTGPGFGTDSWGFRCISSGKKMKPGANDTFRQYYIV